MPEQSPQQAVTPTPPAPVAPSTGPQLPAQTAYGNSFLQDQARQRGSSGRLSWQGALGDTLGGRLYDALSAQLTDDKLLGHANSAVESALSALKGKLDVQASDQEAAALFMSELDKQLKGIAQQAVVNSGLAEGIRDYADVHPYEIALAAIAGAAAYVLSNQDLPLVETKLGLGGGHSLVGGVDVGRTMHLALEQVRVGYRYRGPQLSAELNGDRFQDGWAASGGLTYAPSAGTSMGVTGSHQDRAGVQKSRLDLSYVDPQVAANAYWQQQVGGTTPGQAIGASVASRGSAGDLNRHVSGEWRSDGSWEAAAGVGREQRNSSWAVEGYGGQTAGGQSDVGIRALFKLKF